MANCEFAIPEELDLSGIGSLIELGIKFFLYQRGQIPVPFDSLHSSEDTVVGRSRTDGMKVGLEEDAINIPESITNPKERLKYLKLQKAAIQLEKRKYKQRKRRVLSEMHTKRALVSSFEALRGFFATVSRLSEDEDRITAVVLWFGSSPLAKPKEFVTFHIIDQGLGRNSETVHGENQRKALDMSRISKSFYKSIILSSGFGDFVSRRLHRTTSHLILIRSKPLPEEVIAKHSLRLLDSFVLPVSNMNAMPEDSTNSGQDTDQAFLHTRRPRSDLRSFHIDLQIVGKRCVNIEKGNHFAYALPQSCRGMERSLK